jgi:hypothetical protein
MTRKHLTKKQQFWPGSNIPKSSGNAFDWRNYARGVYSATELSHMEGNLRANMRTDYHPAIGVYSRARHEELAKRGR